MRQGHRESTRERERETGNVREIVIAKIDRNWGNEMKKETGGDGNKRVKQRG